VEWLDLPFFTNPIEPEMETARRELIDELQ
jgi:hypothetical protein